MGAPIEPLLVDTNEWYALADSQDPDHHEVFKALQKHRNLLATSNYILDETLALARFRLGLRVARQLGEQMRSGSLAHMERISRRDEEAAWEIFSNYSDMSFSFTDCTSFALCERLKFQSCIALDNDFRAFGLHCIP